MWATVSSQSCFCWLYRASPSLAAKNIINTIKKTIKEYNQSKNIINFGIDHLVCSCVESSLVLLEKGVCYAQCVFLTKLYWPLSCFILYSKANLPVTPSISWLPTSAFQSPTMKRTFFFFLSVSSRRSCRSSQSYSTSASLASVVGAQTWIAVMLNGLPWKWVEIILSFLRLRSSTAFQTLLLTMRAIPFLLRDSCLHSR